MNSYSERLPAQARRRPTFDPAFLQAGEGPCPRRLQLQPRPHAEIRQFQLRPQPNPVDRIVSRQHHPKAATRIPPPRGQPHASTSKRAAPPHSQRSRRTRLGSRHRPLPMSWRTWVSQPTCGEDGLGWSAAPSQLPICWIR